MNFGRAALLGISGGACDTSYPRCPHDETQLLYYLNNHRGGFFRFFNSGNSFGAGGDAPDNSFLQQQQQLNQQQTSQGLNALALQALADTLTGSNSGNGINLSNLFSSQTNQQRPTVQNYQGLQADQSQSVGLLSMLKPNVLGDVVSNLLTGVIGNRFSRQLNKRSLPLGEEIPHKIEKRIVHLNDNQVKFFSDESSEHNNNDFHHKNTLFDEIEKPLRFSNDNRINKVQQQSSYALKFPHETHEVNKQNFVSTTDVATKLKMLFPDVDNFSEQFSQNLLRLIVNDQRFGKIMTGGGQRPIYNDKNDNINLNHYSINRYPVSQSSSQNYNTGSGSSSSSNYNNNFNDYNKRRPQQNKNSHNNSNSERSHIVYVTNAQGQIEYTLNELTGEKTRYL